MKIIIKGNLADAKIAEHVANLATVAKAAHKNFNFKQVGDEVEVIIGSI